MYLLDTDVVSEMRRGPRADANVITWIRTRPAHELYVSAIALMELELGVLLMRRRDALQGDRLLAWFEGQVLPAFDGRTLSVDTVVARRAAALHTPDRMPDMDALIAASALVHGMVLVTRNVRDFERAGVRFIDPWKPEA